jgi:hypothetical protein
MKKIVNYLKRDLDFPIYIYADAFNKDSLSYPLDLSCMFDIYPFNSIAFDKDGIFQFDYSVVPQPNNSLGKQYNITYISKWALSSLQKYLRTNNNSYKDDFLRHAEWLRDHASERNEFIVWEAGFDWDLYGIRLRKSRVSSMDQGLAISVMVRAYKLTKDRTYYELAKRAIKFYEVSLDEGGFRCEFKPGYIFYEAFPARPISKTLDCFLFSLFGLYDFYLIEKDTQAKNFFEEGMKTLLDNIQYWDYKGIWSRFNAFYLSPPWYHKMNFCWLKIFYKITKDERLSIKAKRWDPASHSFCQRLKIKVSSFILSRWFYFKLAFKQRCS